MKNTRTFVLMLFSFFLVSSSGFSQVSSSQLTIDKEQIIAGVSVYKMYANDVEVGDATWTTKYSNNILTITDRTKVDQVGVDEELATTMDSNTFALRGMTGKGILGNQEVDINLAVEDGYLKGYSLAPRPPSLPQGKIEISLPMRENLIGGAALFVLVKGFHLKVGYKHDFVWIRGTNGVYVNRFFEVTGMEKVTVPAGEFETYKVELRGDNPNQTVYISKDTPRKVVKIEIPNTPWVYKLIKF